MRKTSKLAAVIFTAAAVVGAVAPVASAANSDVVVIKNASGCTVGAGDVVVISQNGCAAFSHSGHDGAATLNSKDKDKGKGKGKGSAAAAAAAAASGGGAAAAAAAAAAGGAAAAAAAAAAGS
ncbi:hypothetical protein NLX86_15200 [Streptomyces sp. A3M-1-3]|uniref:hypothetical protein n=1 Tax=Streptomyces sp. A3M-1-3 TaxID=2962044 RepID=UPI0020B6C68F|nr:hypothetical protein [Streptomyces sp. A3M-1-3]MCP3819403.1 hypothetical protein [Streptomyces sp. A3M-1-3]